MKYFFILICCFVLSASCGETGVQNNPVEVKPGSGITARVIFTDTLAAVFSEISYCSDPQKQLDKYSPAWKIVWQPQAVGGNHAWVATDGERYILAFRGSLLSFTEDAFNNWIYHDLNVAVQDKWPYCKNDKAKVSQGSYIAWQNVEKMKDKTSGKSLWEFLSGRVKDKSQLMLTGHSLGGNVAIVYASYLWYRFHESGHAKMNMNVITFAAPAAGNKAFADDFDNKFPLAVRIENKNDIVAKFPCTDKISKLGDLYTNGPSASTISIGYKNVTTKLSSVFTLMGAALELLEFSTDLSAYRQTGGNGKQIAIDLSGKNKNNTASDWFAEAGYQHGVERYAAALGAPVIACE